MAKEFQITEKDLQAIPINIAGILAGAQQRFTERTNEDNKKLSEFAAGNISFIDLQFHFSQRLSVPRGTLERSTIEAARLTATEQNQINLDTAAVNNFANGLWGYDSLINYFEDRRGEESEGTDDFVTIDNILSQARTNQRRVEIENSFISGTSTTREYFNQLKDFQDAYSPGSEIWQTTQNDLVLAAQNTFDEFGEEVSRDIQEIIDRAEFAVTQAQGKFNENPTELNSKSLDTVINTFNETVRSANKIKLPEFSLEAFETETGEAQFRSESLTNIFNQLPFGTPFKSSTSPEVFLKTASGVQRIRNEQEFFKQFPSFDVVQVVPENIIQSIRQTAGITDQPAQAATGLFRVQGSPAIFQTSGREARAFANEAAFFRRGFEFGQEKVISQEEFDKQFTTGDLIF